MLKFEGSDQTLGVCTSASFMPCFLNQDIITLLSCRGVPDAAFLELQQRQLQQLKDMVHDSTHAQRVLRQYESALWLCCGRGSIFVCLCVELLRVAALCHLLTSSESFLPICLCCSSDSSLSFHVTRQTQPPLQPLLQLYLTQPHTGEDNIVFPRLARLVACGYDITQEPLLAICLGAIQAWMARDMRNKTHVFLEDGCRLLGVMDETGSLQRGQIFLQVQRHRDEPPAVVTGNVLVTRNPCLHPGDVLKLEVRPHHIHATWLLLQR